MHDLHGLPNFYDLNVTGIASDVSVVATKGTFVKILNVLFRGKMS